LKRQRTSDFKRGPSDRFTESCFPSSGADLADDNRCVEFRTASAGPRHRRRIVAGAALVLLLAGCCSSNTQFLRRTCPTPTDPKTAAEAPAPTAAYQVGCPDVLQVGFVDHPEWDAVAVVDVDGRLPLKRPGDPHVDGRTLGEIRADLAQLAGCAPERVSVTLAAPRSGQIIVYGPVRGRARAVPYQGPEPVIDFLKRVGGLPPGSKLNQVYVVRPNVAAATKPQLFRVNVPAVLVDGDNRTNVALQPDDQVYVGETKQSSLSRLMPDWLGTVYRRVTGLMPDDWWPFSKVNDSLRESLHSRGE
jgi:protein involved in polysaccharide export with SLBB domain